MEVLTDEMIAQATTGKRCTFTNCTLRGSETRTPHPEVKDLGFVDSIIDDLSFIPTLFPRITILRLINCKLDEEDLQSLLLCPIVVLNLTGCGLTRFPLKLITPKLCAIVLTNNEITELPKIGKAGQNINTIVLSRNPLAHIEEQFNDLTKLRKLNLTECSLSALPAINTIAIREVRLCNNAITTIPSTWTCLPRLRQLELGHNQLSFIRDLIGLTKATRLQQLGLAGNPCMKSHDVLNYLKQILTPINPNLRVNQTLLRELTVQRGTDQLDEEKERGEEDE
ncbi:Biglycan [Giardia muris]|uniref:Biglycan n=1 Tax=Giardia muris TaxID=5742 RepID=A0A4Z1T0N9_GIAMU|nr:Biglycan [Giardia muris]|eukprot:TNJ30545.1 Biglycan [Giardia muris]